MTENPRLGGSVLFSRRRNLGWYEMWLGVQDSTRVVWMLWNCLVRGPVEEYGQSVVSNVVAGLAGPEGL
jgi:hypothetical protein